MVIKRASEGRQDWQWKWKIDHLCVCVEEAPVLRASDHTPVSKLYILTKVVTSLCCCCVMLLWFGKKVFQFGSEQLQPDTQHNLLPDKELPWTCGLINII